MTASYKAYWFIGLLECVNEEGMCEISIRDLCARMLVNAWYPVHFFRLNFGMFDRISAHNRLIKEHLDLEADISKADLLARLLANKDAQVEQWIMHFKRNVTYRFLSPWIRYSSDTQVARDSLLYLNDAPYAIDVKRNSIRINSTWVAYLNDNYAILKDFAYWQLAQYMQARNPGVPNVINKLIKPATRESLARQRHYWDMVFDEHKTIHCIYKQKPLQAEAYAVEHYIPWSYTAHNLLWNLVPADSSINSSKGNRLPDTRFIQAFSDLQHLGLTSVYRRKPSHPLFDDYAIFGLGVSELLMMEKEKFHALYRELLQPQIQLAKQLGFQDWDY